MPSRLQHTFTLDPNVLGPNSGVSLELSGATDVEVSA